MGLKFLHPHIQTIINDNSSYIEEAVNTSSTMFQPYVSDMGECSRIIKYTSLNDFIAKNGTPDFRKHGQSIYNIVNWLNAGGVVYGYRITDSEATYSNLTLSVKAKVAVNEDTQKNELTSELVLGSESISTKDGLKNILGDSTTEMEPDEEGFFTYPLFAFHVNGKGVYGNDYSIELKSNYSQQSKYEAKVYDFTLKRRDSRGQLKTVEGPYLVSLHPGAVNETGTSIFIKDIIEGYSKHISVSFNQDYYYALMETVATCNPTKFVTEYVAGEGFQKVEYPMVSEEIDYIFWRSNEKGTRPEDVNMYLPYSFLAGFTNNHSLDGGNGEFLLSGTDGRFAMSSNSKERTAAINNAYAEVFSGVTAPEITNKKLYPFEVVLDANYPKEVKLSIYSLSSKRQDFVTFYDTCFQSSVEAAVNFKRENINLNDSFSAVFCQTFTVSDRYTTSEIPVTMTYFLASMIPAHDAKHGVQYPIAGPNRGIVTGFKGNSLNFNPDEDQQETLYTEQLNYIIQDPDGTEISTNLTSQTNTSALSNINNIRVLIKIIKQIESRARHYRHEFSDSATLSSFATSLKIIETEWVNNRACTSLSISPYQTEYDQLQKTCRVSVDVQFNGTIERIIIEVNVG